MHAFLKLVGFCLTMSTVRYGTIVATAGLETVAVHEMGAVHAVWALQLPSGRAAL